MGAPRITLLAAVGPGRVIGDGERMPWHLPEDLKYFKRTTMGHPMVMGRRTFDSMGALPGRRSIVITRQPGWSAEGVVAVGSLEEALAVATDGEGGEEVFVVGGGEIYRLALPVADRLLLTEVHLDPARVTGDVTFPAVDDERWPVTWSEDREGFTWTERLKPSPSLEQH